MAVTAIDLLKMVSDESLEKLAEDFVINKVNTKITGQKIFKLLIHSLADSNKVTLRGMTLTYEKIVSSEIQSNNPNSTVSHSGIAHRLHTINPDYFRAIFNELTIKFQSHFPQLFKSKIHVFDATIITLSRVLFPIGANYGGDDKTSSLKISVGKKGLFPSSFKIHTEQKDSSDDNALYDAIGSAILSSDDIIVFDRGLSGSEKLGSFSSRGITFVTRIKVGRNFHVVKNLPVAEYSLEDDSVDILSDQIIQFFKKSKRPSIENTHSHQFRLIVCNLKKTGEEIRFLTNDLVLTSVDIAKIYKMRWSIEVFFKFLKQELSLKHFLSRSINGITIYLYAILIFSILLMAYKVLNNLTGYRYVKARFMNEIEKAMTLEIVIACGGSTEKFYQRYGSLS